jgi:hypothetical protein
VIPLVSLDYVIRPLQERRRDRQAEPFGSLEDHLQLLHRQIGDVHTLRISSTATGASDLGPPKIAVATATVSPIPGYSMSLTAASMQRTGFAERSLKKS